MKQVILGGTGRKGDWLYILQSNVVDTRRGHSLQVDTKHKSTVVFCAARSGDANFQSGLASEFPLSVTPPIFRTLVSVLRGQEGDHVIVEPRHCRGAACKGLTFDEYCKGEWYIM